ncbi:MAG: glutamate 5-kinase [Dictyoglomus sp.]|nr:glutamate 5-kinase [Dictyoglomus sp.]MCX7942798.1 glutamate 5-kinase [Dictyoglomaceae bacterium]MDW8188394.1 glutamate 5-kinase [Dictyoglomus sp.]
MKLNQNYRRIVIKIGTSSLIDSLGSLSQEKLLRIVEQCVKLRRLNKEVILVSSGAIASGREVLKSLANRKDLPAKQALAAVGQIRLMQYYSNLFSLFKQPVAQILLTAEDLNDRKRFLNISYTFETLLKEGVIPIVNENDTVAVDEIKIGDNDTLSAKVACAVNSDLLIILSDVDGVYTKDPHLDPNAELISEIYEIDETIEKSAGPGKGTGGMSTKISSAKIVMEAGIPMVLANSEENDVIIRIINGERIGTYFVPKKEYRKKRKHWLLFITKPEGKIYIDEGAVEAILKKGKSLLPVGIKKVEGNFLNGDVVSICDMKGKEIARGISNYSSSELTRIIGKTREEIIELTDFVYEEAIHRDNLVTRDEKE